MARRRGRRRGRGGFKIPIISVAILTGQLFAANAGGGDIGAKAARFASYYTGFDAGSRVFDPNALIIGYVPWLAKRFLLPLARVRMPVRGLPISFS